ncbi:CPBP family intramembrane glutamic endopeptidase [Actinoplanes sp. DH11]|uniref:CPBP family intramembrane glutamic endopeptidase n=1 Tax=Actinoplanes sp. DH11 TaxID=2857011 RepID=UPI001E5449DB|nr:CPBP family intramembrane glutamic endopeptidase [Actinoplanes sp. DH11]
MLIPPPPATAYHRLARTAAHRWWRLVLGAVFIVVGAVVLALVLAVSFGVAADLTGQPLDADGMSAFGALGELASGFLTIAALLPLTMLAARWIQRRPAGTLSSVTGRLRWGWLLTCLPIAFLAIVVFLAASSAVSAVTGEDLGLGDPLAGWGPFATSMLVLLLVVPAQAAAEEYLSRGWLLQGVGVWFRSPWIPIAVQALVFAALHGWGTPWGFADLLVFGVITGWLTVRTGGLEAAIVLHVMNNLLSTTIAAAYGDLAVDESAADMPWQMAAIDLPVLLAYAAVILVLARRRGIATRTPALPAPPPGMVPAGERLPVAA